ncbi:peptidylprolyl isomerase [Diaphorobacter sp. HDW4A]|uniref:peptidylprolyl isomerase n=1 Tax=Diaphorobacter sp. HDW4A TaxID=2714924 RepID=UPI00140C43E9|nr:peptidylprolyl isomerase [Diaphorobacter sp. HDW4A]QIL81857.1 peptidylprolyl isomerase [Diaphorobacter sp. HDW4A]
MKMSRQLGVAVLGLCVVTSVLAAQPVVVLEVGTVKVTDQDVRAELALAPPSARERALDNPATLKQIATTLAARRLLAQEAEKNGLANMAEVKAQVQITKERVLSTVRMEQFDASHTPDAKAVEAYARDYYRSNPKAFEVPGETKVSHILIAGDTSDSKAKAEKLLAEIKGGADFAKLAKENSDDKSSAEKGGDLGYSPAGRFVPEFDKTVAGLSKDKPLSDLVKTQFGWHIIQFADKRSVRTLAFEEVSDKLKADAMTKILSDKRLEKNKGLIKDAKIHEDALKAMGAEKPAVAAPAKK